MAARSCVTEAYVDRAGALVGSEVHRGLMVDTSLPDEAVWVEGDAPEIEQVLFHVVLDAARRTASRDPG